MNDVKLFPSLYQTYPIDLGLFRELGLPVIRDAPHSERIEVGTVHFPIGKIKIEVTCLPAQFWRFQLFPSDDQDGQRIILSTGSGPLSDYWPSVMKFLEGMIVVEELSEESE